VHFFQISSFEVYLICCFCQDRWTIIFTTMKLCTMTPCGIESLSVMWKTVLMAGFWNMLLTSGQFSICLCSN